MTNEKVQQDLSQRVFIRLKDLPLMYGMSLTTVYRLMESSEFPQLVTISPRFKGWPREVLDRHFKLVA